MKKLLFLLSLLFVSSAWAQQPQQTVGGRYNASPITLTDKQLTEMQFDINGALLISGTINATSAATATAADPSYVEGTANPFSQDLSGHLRVVGTLSASSVGITGGTTAFDAAAAAVNPLLMGCYASAAAPTGVSADNDATREWCLRNGARAVQPTYAGILGSTGSGAIDTGTPRMALATDSPGIITTGTAGSASSQVLTVQGIASMTPLGVSVASGGIASGALASGSVASGAVASGAVASGAFASGSIAAGAITAGATSLVKNEDVAAAGADAGVPAMAIQLATPADTAADGDYAMVQMSAGRLWTSTNAQPTTAGGLSVYFVQPTASDNHVVIKAGAGQIYKLTVTNNSATVNYIRFYNATTGFNGCNSATNLVYQAAIPASTSVGGLSDSWDLGMAFATGISICVTSGYATTDTTNATASAMSVNVGYK